MVPVIDKNQVITNKLLTIKSVMKNALYVTTSKG